MTDRYAVMGNPIAHSKSPQIHTMFAEQTQQSLTYDKLQVKTENFPNDVTDFYHNGGKGLNITVPLKEEAFDLATSLTPRAQRAGAVNTLILNSEDNYTGDNTDGAGLVRDLSSNHNISLKNKSILILGAGGAVRGILEPFINERPSSITIANRTVSKAEQLAEDFSDLTTIQSSGFDQLSGKQFDIVINGTSASLAGDLPPLPDNILAANSVCYDMMYGKNDTPFMHWSKQQGATHVYDGLGMLVEQAAESFFLWRGIQPDTTSVIQAIRQSL